MNSDNIAHIRQELEDIQDRILDLHTRLQKETIWLGNAPDDLLDAENYIDRALTAVELVLR